MKIIGIVIALLLWGNANSQTPSLEKQALTLMQRTAASDLDAALPRLPFTTWFSRLIGPQAGVIWQLTECGEPVTAPDQEGNQRGKDLRACLEANASLPDGRKVIVAIIVGTFKKGITGKPSFLHAVIESNEQLYGTRGLNHLPEMLSSPAALNTVPFAARPTVKLPAIKSNRMRIQLFSPADPPLPHVSDSSLRARVPDLEVKPPLPPRPPTPLPPPASSSPPPQRAQPDSETTLEGRALTRVKPTYPPNAQKMNAFGVVKVQITISESGHVITAKAVSGHMALRSAAVAAAYQWVFKPTIRNGLPIQMEGILTFDFTPGSQ